MRIDTNNNGLFEVCSEKEISDFFENMPNDINEMWLSQKEYPCMAILIHGEYANVHFFLDECNMWQSVGNCDTDMEFIMNGTAQIISKEYIIPLKKAVEGAKFFWLSEEKPDCIEREEL